MLSFKYHFENLFTNVSRKLQALARAAPYMNLWKRKTLMRAFFNSWFNYFPLKWMCHSQDLNNKLNRLHKRFLRLIFNDKRSAFRKLLDKDSSNTHQKSGNPCHWNLLNYVMKVNINYGTKNTFKYL